MKFYSTKQEQQAQRDINYYTDLVRNELVKLYQSGTGNTGTIYDVTMEGIIFQKKKLNPIRVDYFDHILGIPVDSWCVAPGKGFYKYMQSSAGYKRNIFQKPADPDTCAGEIVMEYLGDFMRRFGTNH